MILALLLNLSVSFASDYQGQASLSNCTGFIFKTQKTQESEKTLLATNGHCLQSLFGMILKPGQVKRNEKATRSVTLYANDGKAFQTKTATLKFATMTGTDLAIYELSESYEDLALNNIYPLILATESPAEGLEVTTISIRKKSKFNCRIDKITNTREGGYSFSQAFRMSEECRQINGTSGSPVMDSRTGEVVAIANTFNKNGKRCTDNNPCEDEGDEIRVMHRARYAQRIIPYVLEIENETN
jgi:hypothetical protein